MNQQSTTPAKESENNSHINEPEPAADQRAPARRNPRLVIGSLDYFELLMEQDEQ